MTSPRPWTHTARLFSLFVLLAVLALPRISRGEKVIAKGDDWQVYTDGRAAGFMSYVHGEGAPIATQVIDGTPENIQGGLWPVPTEPHSDNSRGTVNMMRFRSGFIGNQLGLGVRGQITPWTTVTGYIQIWAYIESDDRNKSSPNPPDVRQGFAKLEGLWGSFLAGRTRTLFSRGATDINVLYAHRWGVGFPNVIDKKGPTQGMVGFGVMGSGFAAGMIYGTPMLSGFQLNVGIFDPATLGGPGYNGTKWVRPEAELTFEKKIGETGKIILFANGTYQKVYKTGQCIPGPESLCDETVEGVGYGGRLEAGPFRLGLAGHYGKGLGLSYALENSYAAADFPDTRLRASDGYYAQGQFVVQKFDLFAGAGISRIFLTDLDKSQTYNSTIKYQLGINAGIVYNLTPNVHINLEYFRAAAKWYLGESQVLNCAASGLTFNW